MERSKLFTVLVTITIFLSLITLLAINLNYKSNSNEELNTPTEPTQENPKSQFSADDDPVKGSKEAPVTIIEFSDFECSFCASFSLQVLPLIEENYIQTGKVKLVFRDFPLDFHPHAKKAAEASECADEQDKYWEYHNKLFENQNALDIKNLKQYAADLGLDETEFNECLDSGTMTSEVEKDLQDGSGYGISGTPTFFISGIKVVGARPYEVFEQVIEQELNS
ncbi:MAG: DsbA family protein [Methanosarcinales archaeon]|nr:DsbA family protein [Methanosarcinales archaeon]